MAVNIPQVVTEVKASGAQVIDASLKFDGRSVSGSPQHLRKMLGGGNNRTWTMSYWFKYDNNSNGRRYISTGYNSDGNTYGFYIGDNSSLITFNDTGTNSPSFDVRPKSKIKDNQWYHLVFIYDSTESDTVNMIKIYINGVEQKQFTNNTRPAQFATGNMNSIGRELTIGCWDYSDAAAAGLTGEIAQFYHLDGQALGPEYFGYTDLLTNTWKPKKFSGSFSGPAGNVGDWAAMTKGGHYNTNTQKYEAFTGVAAAAMTAAAASNSYYDFVPDTPIDGITHVRLTVQRDSSTTSTIELNGTDISSDFTASQTETETYARTELTRLKWGTDSSNQWFGLQLIEVKKDGVFYPLVQGNVNSFYLPFDGTSPIQEDKSGNEIVRSINNGTTWSSSLSASDSVSNGGQAFDGKLTTRANTTGAAAGKTLTFAPSTPITFTKRIEVYCDQGSYVPTATWNGNVVYPGGDQWVTVYSGSGEISSTYPLVIDTQSAAQYATIKAIAVDGKILIDGKPSDDIYPVNFGGSLEINNPIVSGARPILNTDGGGRTGRPGVLGSDVGFYETVSSTSGNGNPYIFDGRGTRPVLNFVRGATYTFDYTSATSHPLLFATAQDANNGSQYTDGTSIVSNTITITVPHNAPDQLWYYCGNHNNMGNYINVTTDVTKADPYAWKCVFASPGTDTREVSSEINCNSTEKEITNNGTMVTNASNMGPLNFYDRSFYYDGSDDFLSTPDHADFSLGTSDFTMECWARPRTYPGTYGMLLTQYTSSGSSSSTFWNLTNGSHNCYFYDGSDAFLMTDPINSVLPPNKWHHLAISREGDVFRLFTNGKLVKEETHAGWTMNNSAGRLTVGADHDDNYHFNGEIQDARMYNGVAKYTGDFVLPSVSPDVYTETPSGATSKSHLTKVTDGAVAFPAFTTINYPINFGDEIRTTGPGTLAASSNWCAECYIYCTGNTSGTYRIISANERTNTSEYFYIRYRNGDIVFHSGNISGGTITAAFNRWTHVAMTKDNNTVRGFIDGKKVWQATDSSSTDITTLVIGGGYGSEFWPGYISNARFVNGSTVYTHDFTPSTEPLTNITNTFFLGCQSPTERQDNFVRMFKSSTLYTTKADILANAQELDDGERVDDEYWYLVPTGNEPIDGANRKAFTVNPNFSTQTMFYWYNSATSAWVATIGGYNNSDYQYTNSYTGFSYQSNDSTLTYSINPSRDFIVAAVNGDSSPSTLNGTVPKRLKYYSFDSAVKPATVHGFANVTSINSSPFNTDINTVRGQETTYPTMNPRAKNSSITLEDGNLRITQTDSHGQKKIVHSTARIPRGGKWFVEWTCEGGAGASTLGIGKGSMVDWRGGDTQIGGSGDTYSWGFEVNGNLFHNGNDGGSYPSSNTNDVIGMTIDTTLSQFKLQFYKNGVLIRNANGDECGYTDIPSDDYVVMMSHHTPNYDIKVNFGQNPFKFPPPDGFQPISNLSAIPDTVITRPDKYVGVTTFQAPGSEPVRFDVFNFQPDLLVGKSRTHTYNFEWVDSVTGGAWLKSSNSSAVAAEYSSNPPIRSFNYNGFTASTNFSVLYNSGDNPQSVVWGFKAGGNKNTFNIDDIGYASAADAKMSVGSLNSTGYNTGAIWSNDVSGTVYPGQTASRLFDGDTSTGLIPNSGTGSLAWTTTAFPSISKLRIYGYSYSGVAGGIRVNGRDYTSLFNTGSNYSSKSKWVEIPEASLSRIEWTIDSGGIEGGHLGAIEVDGKILVDSSGVTPPDLPSLAATGSSVGTKQGFSIVKYNGHSSGSNCTVAHGLSQKPDFMVIKCLDTAHNWTIWHKDLTQNGATPAVQPGNQYIEFTTTGTSTGATRWNRQTPTDHVFHLGTEGSINQGGQPHIAYLWHDVPGLQKFGMYKGVGGTATGQYINCGFRPAIVWVKDMSNGNSNSHWCVYDNLRPGYNPSTAQNRLHLEENAIEDTDRVGSGNGIDILSDGFKLESDNWYETNLSTGYYLYCAWAHMPTINLYGGQANAR